MEQTLSEFYDSTTVFVTGATGFLGKVLVEKLLRSCTGIQKVYILIRKKRGKSSFERFKAIKGSAIFDRIREENQLLLNKLSYIEGDIEEPSLGISDEDLLIIIKTVNIVFHSAANVKFNEDLKEAGRTNSLATKNLLDLCLTVENLKSFVYVSTAYCNPGHKLIREVIYETMDEDARNKFLSDLDESSESLALYEKGPHPNTYTFTKSISEQVVATYSSRLPISIVRPSIVTAAYREPVPGWVEGIQGITGIIIEVARGTLTSVLANAEYTCDIIPVDIVANTMILSAKETKSQPILKIYNCTSGQLNPITWKQLRHFNLKWSRKYPLKICMSYPNFNYTTNHQVHHVLTFLQYTIPALAFDMFGRMKGKKPFYHKLAKKFQNACWEGRFSSLNEWNFDVENQKVLTMKASLTGDDKKFPINIRDLDYEDYFLQYSLGIKKLILNEEVNFHDSRRMLWFYCLHVFLRVSFWLGIFYFMFRVYFNE